MQNISSPKGPQTAEVLKLNLVLTGTARRDASRRA